MVEVVDGLAHGVGVNILPVRELTLLAGQRSDVLLDERTDDSLVKRTNEEEGVVGSVGGALLDDLQLAVIVHLLQVLYMEGLAAPVVVTQGVLY